MSVCDGAGNERLSREWGGRGLVGLDVRGTSADFLEYYRSEFEW